MGALATPNIPQEETMKNNVNTSINIHPHDTPMTFELNPMPEFRSTTFKVLFDSTLQGVNIFLPMTAQEVIALLEEQVANLKRTITETNTDSDELTLADIAEQFDSSPMGQVVNNILNITGK
jgi:hypothetical protein